jgi:hypothetical protein
VKRFGKACVESNSIPTGVEGRWQVAFPVGLVIPMERLIPNRPPDRSSGVLTPNRRLVSIKRHSISGSPSTPHFRFWRENG